MTHGELKAAIEKLVSSYFGTASVVWGSVRGVKPTSPLIVLNLGAIRRHYLPIRVGVQGVPTDSYASTTTLQVDLYTQGKRVGEIPGVLSPHENTAVNDLTDFLNFLNSVWVDEWCDVHDVSLLANNVSDLTEVINDTSWDYRAFLEVEVGFTQTAVGGTATNYEGGVPFHSTGVPKYDDEGYALDRDGNRLPLPPLPLDPDGKPEYPPVEPTPSGGRTQENADNFTGWFEQVEKPEFVKEEPSNGE